MNTVFPIRCTRHSTPLGPVLLRAGANGLSGLWFDGQRHHPPVEQVAGWTEGKQHPLLRETLAQLDDWFAGRRSEFDLPLDLSSGTDFQQRVWHALLDIAHGQTRSYRELALSVGRPTAVRAVGTAVGRNPLSIIVPCHRVVGSDGSLTGYAGGLDRKRALLQQEGAWIATPHRSVIQLSSMSHTA